MAILVNFNKEEENKSLQADSDYIITVLLHLRYPETGRSKIFYEGRDTHS